MQIEQRGTGSIGSIIGQFLLTLSVGSYNGVVGRRVPHQNVRGHVLRLQPLGESADALVVQAAVHELLVLLNN